MIKKIFIFLLIIFCYSLEAQESDWTINPSDFEYNMTITCVVSLNDSLLENTPDLVLGAFVSDTLCRGKANSHYYDKLGKYRVPLMVYSNNDIDTVTFKVYVPQDDYTYDIVDTIIFESDGSSGNYVYPTTLYAKPKLAIISTAGTTATVDKQYTYTVVAEDDKNRTLTYALSNEPDGMVINNNIITWTPTEGVLTSGEVTLSVSNGELTVTEKFTITVNPSSAVQELEIEDVIIYPNPVNNVLNIQCSTKIEQIEVISLNGQVILTRESNATEEQLDMQGLSQGTYLVKIITEQETLVRTILKKSF